MPCLLQLGVCKCSAGVGTIGKGSSVVFSSHASAAGVGQRATSVSPSAEPSWLLNVSGRYIKVQS